MTCLLWAMQDALAVQEQDMRLGLQAAARGRDLDGKATGSKEGLRGVAGISGKSGS